MADLMKRIGAVWLPVFLLAFLHTATVHADEAADSFNDGKRLMGKGQHAEACAAFKRSEDAAGPNVKTRYWLGRCNEEQGKKAAAYLAYKDAKRMSEKAGDTKRTEVIETRIDELGKILPFLVLTVPEKIRVPGLSIKRDGEDVPKSEWGTPVPVDAGKHKITVSAPGMQEITLNVTASEPGSKAQIVIPELAKADSAAPAPTATPSSSAPPRPGAPPANEEPEMSRKSPGLFWTGVGLVSAGGLAVIVGGVLLIQGEVEDGLGGVTDRRPAGLGLMITGGVFLAVGIPFMVVFGKKVPAEGDAVKKEEALLTVQPVITPGGMWLNGTF